MCLILAVILLSYYVRTIDLSSHIIVLVEFINQLCISNVVYIWDDIGCDVLLIPLCIKYIPYVTAQKIYSN